MLDLSTGTPAERVAYLKCQNCIAFPSLNLFRLYLIQHHHLRTLTFRTFLGNYHYELVCIKLFFCVIRYCAK